MRNLLIGLIATVCLTAPACKNEETEKRDNLAKTWRMDKVFLNGNDVTAVHNAAFTNYRISFTRSGEFTETYLALGALSTTKTGSWTFYNSYDGLQLQDGSETRYYDFEKIEDNSLILTEQTGSDLNRYELLPE
jgi:hypothetical protein